MNDNKVKYVGTSLKMAETDIDVLEALSKLYDKLYVSYIIAMMNGMMRCGTIMYVNYFWKGSWMKKQLDKQASEPDRESIFKYLFQAVRFCFQKMILNICLILIKFWIHQIEKMYYVL